MTSPLTPEPKPTIVGRLPDTDIIPLFSTDKSFGGVAVITLEEAGKSIPEEPASICDIAKEYGLKQVVVVDDKIDGFTEMWKNLSKPFKATPPKTYEEYLRDEQKAKEKPDAEDIKTAKRALQEAITKYERESKWTTAPNQLIFGLKMVCCADHEDKSEGSRRTESKIIIFVRNATGYRDLLKVHNAATTTDFYQHARTSWKRLKELWTPNLSLALPFFSSFLAKNQLSFASAVPDFPISARDVTVFREVDSGLPFAPIIDVAIDQFVADTGAQAQRVKSIYYPTRERFRSYMILRCIDNRSTFSKPQVDHLASDRFSWESYLKLIS